MAEYGERGVGDLRRDHLGHVGSQGPLAHIPDVAFAVARTSDRLDAGVGAVAGSKRALTTSLKATGPTLFKVVIQARGARGATYRSTRDFRVCSPDVAFKPAGALTLKKLRD